MEQTRTKRIRSGTVPGTGEGSEPGRHLPELANEQPKEKELRTLNLIYLNARSITNKLNDLAVLINDHNPDVILVTETWCNENTTNAMLSMPGYSIEPDLRVDRRDTLNGIGGGVMVYAKDGLIIKPIPVENDYNMFVRFKIISSESKDDRDLTVTLVYRPPRANTENNKELYKLFDNCRDNNIFIGDFNFPPINWNDYTSDRGSEPFLNCLIDNGFEQLVEFRTHIRGNILNLVLSNKPETVLNIESVRNLSTSDHSILSVDIVFNSFNVTAELINDWKNGDREGLKEYLGAIKW